ncbi:MAG: tetratricopeptide repeat protein [Planctomycetota bacterium]
MSHSVRISPHIDDVATAPAASGGTPGVAAFGGTPGAAASGGTPGVAASGGTPGAAASGGTPGVWRGLLLACLLSCVATPALASDEDFRTGRGWFRNSFYDRAAEALERVRSDRNSRHREEALYLLGESYRALGKLDRAAVCYGALLDEFPSTERRASAELGRGECLARTGDPAAAITHLNAVLRRGESAEARYWLGEAYSAREQSSEAIAAYRALLRAAPKHELAPYGALALASLLKSKERDADAASVLDSFDASRVPTELKGGWLVLRGDLALAAGEAATAAAAYRQVPPGPSYAAALAGLCWAARDLGDAQALERAYATLCEKVASTGPDAVLRSDVDLLYGSWHAGQGNVSVVDRVLRPHEGGSRGNEARFWRGVALANAGKHKEAAQLFGAVRGRDEWSLRAAVHGEAALRQAQEWAEALSLAEAFLTQHADDANASAICAGGVESAYRLERDADVLRLEQLYHQKHNDARWATVVTRFAAEAALRSGAHDEAALRFRKLWDATEGAEQNAVAVRLAHAIAGGSSNDRAGGLRILRGSLSGAAAAEVGVLLGEILRDSSELEAAAKAFRRAAKDDPDGEIGSRAALESAALNMQDPAAAARAYEEVLARAGAGPVRARALIDLADLRVSSGRLEEAVALYETYLGENPQGTRRPQARVGLAFCRWQLGKLPEALLALDGLREVSDPEIASEALYLRGRIQAALGADTAVTTLERYRQRYPQGVRIDEVCLELATLYEKAGDSKRLRACLSESANRSVPGPGHEAALYRLAWCDQEAGRKQDAKAAFLRLLEAYPESQLRGDVHYRLGDLAYEKGHYEDARRHYAATLTSPDKDRLGERAHYRMGWSYLREEQWEQAGRSFLQLADQFPNGELAGEALLLAADAAHNTDELAAERERLQRFVTGHPRHEKWHEGTVRLGEIEAGNGQWQRAQALLDPLRGAELHGEWLPRHRIALARAVRGLGSPSAALPLLEDALAEGKALAAEAKFEIGLTYRKLGRVQEAVDAFMSGAFLYPYRPWAVRSYLEAGRDLLAQDKVSEARRLLARAVEEDPDGEYGREAARMLGNAGTGGKR